MIYFYHTIFLRIIYQFKTGDHWRSNLTYCYFNWLQLKIESKFNASLRCLWRLAHKTKTNHRQVRIISSVSFFLPEPIIPESLVICWKNFMDYLFAKSSERVWNLLKLMLDNYVVKTMTWTTISMKWVELFDLVYFHNQILCLYCFWE